MQFTLIESQYQTAYYFQQTADFVTLKTLLMHNNIKTWGFTVIV